MAIVKSNSFNKKKEIEYSISRNTLRVIVNGDNYSYKLSKLNYGFTHITEDFPRYCIADCQNFIGILKMWSIDENKYGYSILAVYDKVIKEFATLSYLGDRIFDDDDRFSYDKLEQNLYKEIHNWRTHRYNNEKFNKGLQEIREEERSRLKEHRLLLENDRTDILNEMQKQMEENGINMDIFA